MQAPLIVFDHKQKTVVTVKTTPAGDRKLDAVLESQRSQVATSGRPSS
jgi:hypothetical protein